MKFQQITFNILDEVRDVLKQVRNQDIKDFIDIIARTERIFVVSGGREALASRAFAMRLMHLGKTTYYVWDDTTPRIGENNLLIANCGPGSVVSVYNVARLAKEAGASVSTVTANPDGDIAKLSDVVVFLPAQVMGVDKKVRPSIQPMGSLFEQCLWIFHDSVTLMLMERMKKTASDMSKRHRNVE